MSKYLIITLVAITLGACSTAGSLRTSIGEHFKSDPNYVRSQPTVFEVPRRVERN